MDVEIELMKLPPSRRRRLLQLSYYREMTMTGAERLKKILAKLTPMTKSKIAKDFFEAIRRTK